jgi:hypothetical protein
MARLKELRDKVGAASYAEVVRGALRLYEGMLNDISDGSELILRKSTGEEIKLKIVI